MPDSFMLLPQIQVFSTYFQPGSASVWIGAAEAVSIQCFADGFVSGDQIHFKVQQATSQSDDHFVDSPFSASIDIDDPKHTKIITIPYGSISGFIRMVVVPQFSAANSMNVRCQANLKGIAA